MDTAQTAQEFSQKGAPIVQICSWAQARVAAGMMPLAPVPAARAALQNAGLSTDQIQVIKTHNPFAVNDIVLSRELGCDWQGINQLRLLAYLGAPARADRVAQHYRDDRGAGLKGGRLWLFTGCAAGIRRWR